MAGQRGFDDPSLKFFDHVHDDALACAAAMRAAERVIIEDVTRVEIQAVKPSQKVPIDAGVRAVISTPLMSATGNLLTVTSTHFSKPHRPSERELHLMDLLARQAADYLERKRAEEVEKTLVREVQHRDNNLLSVVQAVANPTLSGDRSLARATESFEERLQALARANRQLSRSNWSGVNLSEIVQLELKPFAERTTIEGVDVMLAHQQAQNLSLALHELATNADKYGSFSNRKRKAGGFLVKNQQGWEQKTEIQMAGRWRTAYRCTAPPWIWCTSLLKATFADVRIDYASQGLRREIDIPFA